MSKILYALLFLSLVSLGTSLKCLSCSSEDSCKDPITDTCDDEAKYCVSVGVPRIPAYFKGCTTDEDVCDTKDSDGNKAYPQCNVCDSDECNTDKLV